MKSYYDVAGSGRGHRTDACVLFSQKGFSCLWADTAHQVSGDSPQCSIRRLSPGCSGACGQACVFGCGDIFLESLQPEPREGSVHRAGQKIRCRSGPVNGDLMLQQNTVKYPQLLGKSMTRPGALRAQRPSGGSAMGKDYITALCRPGNRITFIPSLDGLALRHVLARLSRGGKSWKISAAEQGRFFHVSEADVIVENGRPSGLRVNSTQVKSRYFIWTIRRRSCSGWVRVL